MAQGKAVTYEGTTDSSVHDSGTVEIDGVTLEKGVPVEGLSAEQIKRLEDTPYHRFTVGAPPKDDGGDS